MTRKILFLIFSSTFLFGIVVDSLPVIEESDDVKLDRRAMENPDLFEGDIDLGPDRNAIEKETRKWPNGIIYYTIHEKLKHITPIINQAVEHYRNKTCIRWEQRTNQTDYVMFYSGVGCHSKVGRIGGYQDISLGLGCNRFKTVVHEMMHAIGFWHEQSRSDRDKYIEIHWKNVNPIYKNNFNVLKPSENRLFTDFDFDSIMLYGPTAFSQNGKVTMSSKVPGKQIKSPASDKHLSQLDILSINKLYNCGDYLK